MGGSETILIKHSFFISLLESHSERHRNKKFKIISSKKTKEEHLLVFVWLSLGEQTGVRENIPHHFTLMPCPLWHSAFKVLSILAFFLSLHSEVPVFHFFPLPYYFTSSELFCLSLTPDGILSAQQH